MEGEGGTEDEIHLFIQFQLQYLNTIQKIAFSVLLSTKK